MKNEAIIRELDKVAKDLRDEKPTSAAERIGWLRGRLDVEPEEEEKHAVKELLNRRAVQAVAEEASSERAPILTTKEICEALQKTVGALIGNGVVASEENVAPGPNPALAVALISKLLRRIRESPVRDSMLRPLAR